MTDLHNSTLKLNLKRVFVKNVKTYVEKYAMVIATNLTSACCVCKEKIVKNDSYRRPIQIQKVAIFESDSN